MKRIEARKRFDKNEKILEDLAAQGKYCYQGKMWPYLMPYAQKLEQEQNWLMEMI